MTGTAESNSLMSTIKIICCTAEMSAVRAKAALTDKSSAYIKGHL